MNGMGLKTFEQRLWLAVVLGVALGANVSSASKYEPPPAGAWQPAVVDGDPALQFSANGWSTFVAVTSYKGESAIKLPVRHYRGGDGYLYIAKTRLAWEPVLSAGGDQAFDVSPNGIRNKSKFGCEFTIDGNGYSFMALFQRGGERDRFPKGVSEPDIKGTVGQSFRSWCDAGLGDFRTALAQFRAQVGDSIWANSPDVKAQRQAAEQAFQQRAAAWRAAGSKVNPPEEAQRHFAIAQAAFQEKNFQHQAEELSAALAIYPTWPAEQSDLAVILGELNRYSEAIGHMQMYLELVPDAPDAQRAKQQIWIWQDKLKSGN